MAEIDIEITLGRLSVISVPVTAVGGRIVAGATRLVGWSLRETTGEAAASLDFTSGGNLVASSGIAEGLSDTHFLGSIGVPVLSDITIANVTGSIQGAVYVVIE